MGVQAPAAISANPGVPVAGRSHGLRHQGRGRRGSPPHLGALRQGVRGVSRRTRGPGQEDREGEVRGGRLHHDRRGLHIRQRQGHPGRHQPPLRAKLLEDVRHPGRGTQRGQREDLRLPELLGTHHQDHRRHGHGPRGRQGPRAPTKGRLRAGHSGALRHNCLDQRRAEGQTPGGVPEAGEGAQGRAEQGRGRLQGQLQPRVEVQPLGVEGHTREGRAGTQGSGEGPGHLRP